MRDMFPFPLRYRNLGSAIEKKSVGVFRLHFNAVKVINKIYFREVVGLALNSTIRRVSHPNQLPLIFRIADDRTQRKLSEAAPLDMGLVFS